MNKPSDEDALVNAFTCAVAESDILIAITDHTGKVSYANKAFQDAYENPVGRKIDSLCAKFSRVAGSFSSDTPWSGLLSPASLDEPQVYYQAKIIPVPPKEDQQAQWIWQLTDVSAQKKLEKQDKATEKRLNSMLDNVPAYVFSKDRDGRYTYVNKMLAMLHAMKTEDILGKKDHDLFVAEAADTFIKNDKEVFEKGRTIRALEHGGIDEYGIERSYLSVKCPLEDDDGNITEMLGMSVDISEQVRLEKAFRASEEKLASILNNMKARVYIKDTDFKYTYGNEELCRVMSTDRANIIGKDDFELFDTETAITFRTTDEEVFKTGEKVARMESSIEPDTKERRYYWTIKVPLLDAHGIPHSLLGISTDITDQKRMEKALRQNEAQLTTILDNLKAHVYIKDVNFSYTYVNKDMCDYLGLSKEDIEGKQDSEIFGEEAGSRFHKNDQHVFNYRENSTDIEKSTDPETGKQRYFWSVKVPLVNELGNPYALLGISTDVTEQKRLENELRELASTDVLTGVNNRRNLLELCIQEIKRAQRYENPLSLIMLDMDHFKRINDSFGHAVGDEAIKTMTGLCKANLRETDVIGRIGGEEFALLLPETGLEEALQIAERIRKSTEKHAFDIGADRPCKFTASFGVTTLKPEDNDPDDLLKRADIALYDAKTLGRNRVSDG